MFDDLQIPDHSLDLPKKGTNELSISELWQDFKQKKVARITWRHVWDGDLLCRDHDAFTRFLVELVFPSCDGTTSVCFPTSPLFPPLPSTVIFQFLFDYLHILEIDGKLVDDLLTRGI